MKKPILDKILHHFSVNKPHKLAGVDVYHIGNRLSFHAVILEKKKDEVILSSQALDLVTFADLYTFVGDDVAVHLSVNLRGVLYKHLPMQQEKAQLFQTALPNANMSDFYWQSEVIDSGNVVVCIARKNAIDVLLEQFQQAGLWVTGLTLGPFDVQHILAFLPPSNLINAHDLALNFSDKGKLVSFEKVVTEQIPSTAIKIGDDFMDSRLLPAYATAFKGIFLGDGDAYNPVVKQNRESFFHKQLIKRSGLKVLVGLLLVLLVNSFFYFFFKNKDEMAKMVLSKKRAELALLDSLEKSYKAQEDFMQLTQVNKASKASFYADRIAASMPAGIQLLELEVFPLKGKKSDYEQGDMFQYDPNSILIRGQCDNSLVYNQWLRGLEMLDWVSTVEHLTYKETGTSQKEFELKIIIGEPSK